MSLLDGLQKGDITFHDAEKRSEGFKQERAAKEAFQTELGLTSQEEVEKVLTDLCTKEQLQAFRVQKGKALPSEFTVR